MVDTFPTGQTYLVPSHKDDPVMGRQLLFVLPSGEQKWVSIGDDPDTKELRDGIADALIHKRRYIKGAKIAPPNTSDGNYG